MWSKYIHFEVIVICFLSLIPWPGPSVFKISCSRESARVVRKIVQSKWLPILEKYHVKIPLECPFHPMRDIFGPQQAAKVQNRPSQWTCGFCGKSFYDEPHLDQHFEHRHGGNINMAEDAVCLADYCDIMRCKVLASKDGSFGDGNNGASTDIEIWREATAYRTALQPTGPRDLAKIPTSHNPKNPDAMPTNHQSPASRRAARCDANADNQRCDKRPAADAASEDDATKRRARRRRRTGDEDEDSDEDEYDEDDDDAEDFDEDDDDEDDDDEEESDDVRVGKRRRHKKDNATAPSSASFSSSSSSASQCDGDEDAIDIDHLVDSMRPPIDYKEQRILEMQRMKANCKADDLERLKTRCEVLTRNCVVGLLGQMADEEFYKMEDELNKAVCWYLTCDRYWEDGPLEQRPFPWGLVFVLVMVLSLGVCFCYYIIWILFDSTDEHHPPGFGGHTTAMQHHQHQQQLHQQQQHLHMMYDSQYQQHHHQHLAQPHHQQYAMHPSPKHQQQQQHQQQYIAATSSSTSGYGTTTTTPLQQPSSYHQHQHSTQLGPHGPSGLLTSHPPSASSASSGVVAVSAASHHPSHHHHHQASSGVGPTATASAPMGAVVAGASSTLNTATAVASGLQHHHHQQLQQQQFADEFYVAPEFNNAELAGQSEHYIYVTYPPELKRRLLESCYNRTTRL